MREIITLQIGQCGINVGAKFWELIAYEHGLNSEGVYIGSNSLQLHNLGTYFSESHRGTYVPRSVFIDLEPGSVEMVNNSAEGRFFSPEKSVSGTQGASNNYAKGYYTDGAELLAPSMEIIRRDAEACDSLQGFQIIHSLGGGCGAGLGSLMMMKILEEYTDRIISAYSVYPSPKVSDIVVEPYNATLAIHQLIEYADFSIILDNEALVDICNRTMRIPKPTYCDMNHLICYALSGTTACLRFPGQLNSDLRKIATNMIPFPRLHFFMTGYAPMSCPNDMKYRTLSVADIMHQLFDPKNMMAACNPIAGRYLTAASIFRGHVSTKEVEEQLLNVQNKYSKSFIEWIPDNIKVAMCDIAPPGMKISSTFLANNTSMGFVMKRISEAFSSMLKRKAFLHWFLGEGMEEREFLESQSNMVDLISEYEQYQEASSQSPSDA